MIGTIFECVKPQSKNGLKDPSSGIQCWTLFTGQAFVTEMSHSNDEALSNEHSKIVLIICSIPALSLAQVHDYFLRFRLQ